MSTARKPIQLADLVFIGLTLLLVGLILTFGKHEKAAETATAEACACGCDKCPCVKGQ